MLKGHRPHRPDHPELSDRLWGLIEKCWEGGPAQRKTIAEVVGVLEGGTWASTMIAYQVCLIVFPDATRHRRSHSPKV